MVPRLRKPGSLKAGKSESLEQRKRRAEIESQLMGNSDDLSVIPAYLSEEEQIYYKWLIKEIEIANIIANLDKPLLEQTASCIHAIRVCDDKLRQDGYFIDTYDKYGNLETKEHPAAKAKQNWMTKYSQLCNQLGLSPSARASLAGKQIEAKQNSEDPVLKILGGGL